MNKKLMSFLCCILILLSTIVVVGGCGKDKPVSVSKQNAEKAIVTAMQTIETSEAVKVEIGEMFYVATSETLYQKVENGGIDVWTEKDGNYWYRYFSSVTMVGDAPSCEFNRSLSAELQQDPRHFVSDLLNDYIVGNFQKASKFKNELTITYKLVLEETTTETTLKLINSKLSSLTIKTENSETISLEYDDVALQDFNEKPKGIEWFDCESRIEVEGIKTEYVLGEELDLTSAVLNFFEDLYTQTPYVLELKPEMVLGFTTEELGTKTMTIKFCNLTVDVEYTVTEPAVAE